MPVMSEEEAIALAFHNVPDAEHLAAMSFAELAFEFSAAHPGTPRHIVIERELKRVLAKDQAKAYRSNIYIGGVMAGVFGLFGVLLGWWLREASAMDKPAYSNTLQQSQPAELSEKPKVTEVSPINSVPSKSVSDPAPAASNSAKGNPVP